MTNPNTRPTMAQVEAMILTKTYTRLPSGTAIVCELTLQNLHPVHGIAMVVDMENHNDELGCKAAYSKALDKAFEVMAYLLHQRMACGAIPNNHEALVQSYKIASGGQPVAIVLPTA